jgi:hypothetical protein
MPLLPARSRAARKLSNRGAACLAVAVTSGLFLLAALLGSGGSVSGPLLWVLFLVAASSLASLACHGLAARSPQVRRGSRSPVVTIPRPRSAGVTHPGVSHPETLPVLTPLEQAK